MTIKNSGNPLSYSEIRTEFGNPSENKLGNYRVSQTIGALSNLPLDTGVPQSVAAGNSAISFSNFYGKQANLVMDMHTVGNQEYDFDVYDNVYEANKYTVVGNTDKITVPKDQWQGGKKVIIHINKEYGSKNATSSNDVAVKTGNINDDAVAEGWPTATTFAINVGPQGRVQGKGGAGAPGGNEEAAGVNGGSGTSAMKLVSGMQNVVTIQSGGIIAGGGGGGGSGAGSEQNDRFIFFSDYNSAGGGGGGGGAGIPAGSGGSVTGEAGAEAGNADQAATSNVGGSGGEGGDDSEAEGGNGGAGGGLGAGGGNASGGADSGSMAGPNGTGGSAGSQYLYY